MKIKFVVALILSILLISSSLAFAKSSNGGGFGGSSSRSSSSSSSGTKNYSNSDKKVSALTSSNKYGNSDKTTAAPGTTAPTPSKYGNSDKTSTQQPTTTVRKSNNEFVNKGNQQITKEQSVKSYEKYKSEQSQFKGQSTPIDTRKYSNSSTFTAGTRSYNPQTYTYRRDVYYTRVHYVPASYVYYGPSYYGMWDTVFLYSMLGTMDYNFYYHHQNDPDVQRWRAEANLQAEKNADLKAQLAAADQKIAAMKGQPVDPNYVPKDVDPDLMLSKVALDQASPESHFWRNFFLILLCICLIAIMILAAYKIFKKETIKPKYRI